MPIDNFVHTPPARSVSGRVSENAMAIRAKKVKILRKAIVILNLPLMDLLMLFVVMVDCLLLLYQILCSDGNHTLL